jgi:hypothetical protein
VFNQGQYVERLFKPGKRSAQEELRTEALQPVVLPGKPQDCTFNGSIALHSPWLFMYE